jgi:hypothetical protein
MPFFFFFLNLRASICAWRSSRGGGENMDKGGRVKEEEEEEEE